MHTPKYQIDTVSLHLSQLGSVLTQKDVLPKQLFDLSYAINSTLSSQEKIKILSNALSYTLPDFDIHLIYNYRLSWAELSLLTNIAINYQSIDPNKSILYFSKILDYCGLNSFDICFTATFLSPVLTFFCTNLYIDKHFYKLLDLFSEKYFSAQKKVLCNLGYFFFYYAQALGEVHNYTMVKCYGHYACAIQELYETKPNSDVLKEYLLKDFDITLV